jgi:GAF domain-containing protein/biotin carboxyl carrier protein
VSTLGGGAQQTDRAAIATHLAAELAQARSERDAAVATARAVGLWVGADSVRVWVFDRTQGYRFAGAWPDTGEAPERPAQDVARAIAFGAPAVGKTRSPNRSRLIVPLIAGLRPIGAVELVERKRDAGPFGDADIEALRGLVDAADDALDAVRRTAARESRLLEATTRLARLFDLTRSIAGTLDHEALPTLIVERVRHSFEIENVYLWLVDAGGQTLRIAAAAGPAAAAVSEWECALDEGAAGAAAQAGEPLVFDDPEELPGLEARPDAEAGLEIRQVAVAPIAADGELLGVLEAVNREDGEPLDDSTRALVREVAEVAAVALINARRVDAERRASSLGALVETVQELTSHLDPRKVTFALVHKAASVLSYRRAAVGLVRGTGVELAAVSGQTFVDETLPEMKKLRGILEWASGLDEGILVVQEDDGTIDTDRPETREKFQAYFEETKNRSFLALPLHDDEGRLGVLTLEAAEPYAFSVRDMEVAGLLAAQATVAIRNATLYERIPMVRVFQPLAERRARWAQTPWARRVAWIAGALAAIGLLFFVPVPLRVGGAARVLPEVRRPVSAEVDGRVARVLVREGDRVEAGTVVALLDDAEFRSGREAAASRHAVAASEERRHRAEGAMAEVAADTARLDGLAAELELWDARLERTRLRSPVAGVVGTPRIDEHIGAKLERGEVFCEIVDPARQRIEVRVAEADAGLLHEGLPVKVKLNAYPTRSFHGRVVHVGVAAIEEDRQRVLLAHVQLDDAGELLRSGMSGEAKIRARSASLVHVALRRPARWLWGLVWGWLP